MRTNFPRSIATRLLGSWSGCGGELRRENVSVFFSDVVGFTRMSSTMPAAKVASMLDRLFRRMDSLGREYGMEKIDVIGDAYIVACNFMKLHEDDHALRCAMFATATMRIAEATLIDEDDPSRGRVVFL